MTVLSVALVAIRPIKIMHLIPDDAKLVTAGIYQKPTPSGQTGGGATAARLA
jgi:hypothetical protein